MMTTARTVESSGSIGTGGSSMTEVVIAAVLVPYQRFLECRERRIGVAAERARYAAQPMFESQTTGPADLATPPGVASVVRPAVDPAIGAEQPRIVDERPR
jgi:hypothetical protein